MTADIELSAEQGSVYRLQRYSDPTGEKVVLKRTNWLSARDQEVLIEVPGLAELCTQQNAAMQAFFRRHGLRTAYIRDVGPTEALYHFMDMYLLELIGRLRIGGSAVKRYAEMAKGRPELYAEGASHPRVFFEVFAKHAWWEPEGKLVHARSIKTKVGPNPPGLHTDPFLDAMRSEGGHWDVYDAGAVLQRDLPLGRVPALLTQEQLRTCHRLTVAHGLLVQAGFDELYRKRPGLGQFGLVDFKLEVGGLNGQSVPGDTWCADMCTISVDGRCEFGWKISKILRDVADWRPDLRDALILAQYTYATKVFGYFENLELPDDVLRQIAKQTRVLAV